MKKNIEKVVLMGAKKDVDFKVVSNAVQMNDGSYHVYKDGMDLSNAVAGGETPFPSDTKHVWRLDDQLIDVELAVTLALGVIQDIETGERFIYHADGSVESERSKKEHLRMGMYYQLTHPEYDDKKLDTLLQQKGGEEYLSLLLLVDDDSVFARLHEIFGKRKGVGNNIAEFKRKDV